MRGTQLAKARGMSRLSKASRLARQGKSATQLPLYRDLYCHTCRDWTDHMAPEDGALTWECDECGSDAQCDECGAPWHEDHDCDEDRLS